MIALEWNIGIDTYTVSPVPSPNRPASIRPGPAIFPCVHLTAFGSPLVPDVKISMSRSSGPGRRHLERGARGQVEPVERQHRDVHRGQQRRVARFGQHVLAVGPGHVPGQGFAAPDRVERDEHRAGERAPAEQEGELGHVVGQHPHVERPARPVLASAAPASAVLASAAPRAQRGGVPRHSPTCSRQLHRRSSNRSPGSGSSARASSSPVTVGSAAGTVTAIGSKARRHCAARRHCTGKN